MLLALLSINLPGCPNSVDWPLFPDSATVPVNADAMAKASIGVCLSICHVLLFDVGHGVRGVLTGLQRRSGCHAAGLRTTAGSTHSDCSLAGASPFLKEDFSVNANHVSFRRRCTVASSKC